MSELNPKTTADRHRRLPAVSAAILIMLTVVTSVVAEDPPPQDAGRGTFEEKPLAVVRTTTASGFDLQAILDWSHTTPLPATAELRLYDGRSNLVASEIAAVAAGRRTVEVLPDALGGLFNQGFQYRLEVVDLESGTAMAAPHHLRVFIDCPASEICTLRTADGLEADRVAIDKELMLLLDDLESKGSQNLLGDALDNRPDLRGEILTLAKQLGDLAEVYSLEGCVCLWVPSFAESPEDEQSLDPPPSDKPPYPDFEIGGSAGPGATFGAGVQIVRGPPQHVPLGGHSKATMDLRCWNISEGSIVSFQLGTSLNNIELPIPVLDLCQQSCHVEIRSQAGLVGGKLEVEAYGSETDGASAMVNLGIRHFVVDQANQEHQLFSIDTDVQADADAYRASRDYKGYKDLEEAYEPADKTISGSRLTAVIETTAMMSVEASDKAYALAIANVGFWMNVTGRAACAVEPTSSIWLSTDIDDEIRPVDDGLEIERWGHPR